eukprot:m.72058 g.72058  ORF g.72058 m.72058 type:complete len:97 (-) comp12300_c0_seq4:248-538(-)
MLSMITLNENLISYLDTKYFGAQLSQIAFLGLSYNKITSVDPEFFKGLGFLNTLLMDGNELTSLGEDFKYLFNQTKEHMHFECSFLSNKISKVDLL